MENYQKRAKQHRNLLVICPKCKSKGVLYFSKRDGWFVKHDYYHAHYIHGNVSLEIPYDSMNMIVYAGGDYYLLSYITKMIPPHTCYVEVFGGGGVLLLSKPPSKNEVYNDIDGNLVNLFKVVRDRYDEFMKRLDWLLYSRQLYYEFLKELNETKDDVERAVMYYYLIHASFSGIVGAGFSSSKTTRNRAHSFFSAVNELRRIHERLKNVVIEQLDFRECIKRYDAESTFFYLDPPHLYFSTEKGHLYVHGFSDDDYIDFLNLLENIKGKFLLKQNYMPYVIDWAEKHSYNYRIISIPRFTPSARETNKREYQKVVFIANYKL